MSPKSDYGGLTTASADETAARLIISPIAEITTMRSMLLSTTDERYLSTASLNGK
jgi:hypothetical protein